MHPQAYPLEALLLKRYAAPEWATLTELSAGVGSMGPDRRADVVSFNCWPSKGCVRLAFEIKRSRADFMREVDDPGKRAWLEKYFHQTYFVVVPGIVKEDEVPEGWGLLVATKSGDKLIRRKAARHREAPDLPEFLALSAIRRLVGEAQAERTKHYTFEGETLTQADLDSKTEQAVKVRREQLDEQWNQVRKLRQTLEDRKSALEGPLTTLARQAGDYRVFGGWEDAPDTVTSADVHRFIAKIRAEAVHTVMVSVRGAHTALGELIAAVTASDLDEGAPRTPRVPRKRRL
jgi:hypothetical protein